ncbi:hypothetical protein ABBQ38_008779 [Trebouxia sp. C0009 RCD-2024]
MVSPKSRTGQVTLIVSASTSRRPRGRRLGDCSLTSSLRLHCSILHVALCVSVTGIVTLICAALYPTVVSPTISASQQHQENKALARKAQAGFVKKGMWTEMQQKPSKTV